MGKTIAPTARHEAFRQEMIRAMRDFGDVPAWELLAVASQFVGQLIAIQDQRTVTPDAALDAVQRNILIGNEAAMAEILQTKGNA